MDDDAFLHVVTETAEVWSGIAPPNDTARHMAADLRKIIVDFEAVRGRARFEDEPSDFEAALHACRENG
ncbi:hypothetical protein [Roseomonas elaeocarpi]|uniref:Uncharacterized protein n=1 Tax=Roseomonas elaeocarpi TaxID=907779 RepID=A0ABV6JWS0_9PROT